MNSIAAWIFDPCYPVENACREQTFKLRCGGERISRWSGLPKIFAETHSTPVTTTSVSTPRASPGGSRRVLVDHRLTP